MPDRIDRVTTRTGDEGKTSLADGKRYPKEHDRLELTGNLDEANCALGVLIAHLETDCAVHDFLLTVQSRLFDVGAAAATGTSQLEWHGEIEVVEQQIALLNQELEPLREFVLPGGNTICALAHMARATMRRAERAFWRAKIHSLIDAGVGAYLNRLSDYLFVIARTTAAGVEQLWQPVVPDNTSH